MSSSIEFAIAVLFSEIIPAAILLYAAYWSFQIRQALAGPIYRSHALWLGVVSILAALSTFLTYSSNFAVLVVLVIFYNVTFVVLFAFFDSTVKVARRSDPLLRDILKWKELRIVGWAGVGLIIVFNFLSLANAVYGNVVTYLIVIPLAAGCPAIIVGGRRSRDPLLRNNLKWLGLALLDLLVLELVTSLEAFYGWSVNKTYYSYYALIIAVFWISGAYAVYKSARSLAPVNRLSQEVAPKTEPLPP
jgi:hypothetical protein